MVRIFLLFLLVLSSCKRGDAPKAKPTPKVTTITVEKQDAPVSYEFVATTESSQQVNIQARVNGFLDKRVYTEGEIVDDGQVLFIMDKKPFEAQLAAAKAALEAKKAVQQTAKLNLDRTKPLAKLNALSQKDLDDAIGTYDSATAGVHEAEANVITAELNLSYATIVSPFHGITSSAQIQDGSYLSISNNQLTTVSKLDPIWVNFSISEIQMQQFRNEFRDGTLLAPKDDEYEVDVILIDGSTFPHVGKITFTEPYFNPQTGTFLIRASVANPKGVLRPNQFVKARVKGATRPDAILIPQRAVLQSAKGHYVWTVSKEGIVDFRPIEVGSWEGENWFITQGLFPGDVVVVDGGQMLHAGEKVNVEVLHP